MGQRSALGSLSIDDVLVIPSEGRSSAIEFEEFVRQSASALETTAYLLVGDRHRAEEMTQRAYERVWRAWSRARLDPLPYARRVLVNLRVDDWRRRRRELLVADVPERVASPAFAVDERDRLVRALLTLPKQQRKIVVLRHLLDLSVADVSEQLGVSPGTVKSSASRGLAALRTALGEDGT